MLEKLKQNRAIRLLYRLPFAVRTYHFLLALLGALRFGFPGKDLVVVGITGTKGKTSTAEILNAILEAAGKRTALLSSLRVKLGTDTQKNRLGNSMPGRFFIERFLRNAVRRGAAYAIIEVTSQGVVLSRHRFIDWSVAAITNIHPEHIESHGSFENYRNAKLAFLRYAAGRGAAVFVNLDDEPSAYFKANVPEGALMGYDRSILPPLPARAREMLPGRFNEENIAAAVAIARFLNIPEDAVTRALENFKGVEGRAEFVRHDPFKVVVDYAHTPDSLRAIYGTVREMVSGRMICVLGAAGGGRDRWKRPAMGEAAAYYCDEVILTNEDPYDEPPEKILDDIAGGFGKSGKPYRKVLSRRAAIRDAVSKAKKGDAVVITGKGSEASMHLAHGEIIEWSDREIVEEAIRSLPATR